MKMIKAIGIALLTVLIIAILSIVLRLLPDYAIYVAGGMLFVYTVYHNYKGLQ